jgi:glutathione synthase (EC 6.3.2.3)
MTIKFGMVMDSIDQINIKKDTSFAMLLEAQSRNWEIHYMELNDLYLNNGKPCARTRILHVQRDQNKWYEFIEEQDIALENLDTIIMRKDPPFDQEYIYATYLLEQAERLGTYVVNKPQSLRDANEKLFTAWFPQCCAETLVAREPQRFKQFLDQHKEMILKPLDGMGGTSIFHVRENDPNLNVILEIMTEYSSRYIMAQRYIPDIKDGDKRILLINGEPVPYALARIPAQGESRGNLAAGGRAGRPGTIRKRFMDRQTSRSDA